MHAKGGLKGNLRLYPPLPPLWLGSSPVSKLAMAGLLLRYHMCPNLPASMPRNLMAAAWCTSINQHYPKSSIISGKEARALGCRHCF